jgi:hypothetical protein
MADGCVVARDFQNLLLNHLFLADSPVSGTLRLILYRSKFFDRQVERPDGTITSL